MSKLQNYLQNTPRSEGFIIPRVFCPDGLSVSVQASEYAYSSPRDREGPWSSVELGFPSEAPGAAIMQYAEQPDQPTETVYGYVPIAIVEEWLAAHGWEG